MFKFITNNWAAKLVCILVAVGLWAYVAIGESKVDNLPGKLPLQIKNTPSDLTAIVDEDSVQVKISADRSTWSRLSSNSIIAYIDLNGLTQGTHEVSVLAESTVSNVEIIDITPKKVLVRLEPIIKKKVPVRIQTSGQAGEGLVAGEATIEPSEVEISGAESVVGKILEATASVALNGETNQIEKNIPLVALDSNGEEIKNVSFNPKEAKVTLPLVKAGTTKSVGIKAQITGKPKSGYWINQVIITPSNVTISGSSGILRGISYLQTKAIDVEGISQNLTKQIDLDVPSGATLDETNSQVKVEIQVSVGSSEKEISAGLIYDNLSSLLKVDSIDPNAVKIVVSGPTDVLSTLSSSNVQVHLNLGNIKSSGAYNIDIDRNSITVPDGMSVSSYVPSAIKVNLSNK
jgi:YbbR domain-containing protein